ncbi:type I-MYXAN CRISPR-associated protein Cas6/Cmx6 [Thermochromatium tepidum]|uniref:Type I-MYXAN CRISPR-associated protein Cas6/Cmx6 n=1 Tax=Thermochromatium tepidum ATCC 43061 TaxID=316276 RepID=A0A6I6EG37_THETI|nr:type I-MYXAN CRISPR-associated protein Cas6/Cmx6 [Thermochromatium tepidum]QGU33170.1 type I-MYXAN CRISPR-associated protein Cas6/Cmx6 [Thermochromatium tepidum ATCC 43061]
MFWNEDDPTEAPLLDDIVDLLFTIDCKCLPVDHAYALSSALRALVPWFDEEPHLGVHTIHVAGSQNGWERPEHSPEALIMVSRRTKLRIRVPSARADDLVARLQGQRIEVGGQPLTIGAAKPRPLSQETTIFTRYLAADSSGDAEAFANESRFLEAAARALGALDIRMRKALCGKTTSLYTPAGPIHTRALMLAGLTREESMRLQREGLGPYRTLGCGLFIPHKGIDPVRPPT